MSLHAAYDAVYYHDFDKCVHLCSETYAVNIFAGSDNFAVTDESLYYNFLLSLAHWRTAGPLVARAVVKFSPFRLRFWKLKLEPY